MAENHQDILEIIDESFLGNEEKQLLKDQLVQEGPSESFFKTMNQLLIGGLEKKSEMYEKVINEFEAGYKTIDDAYKTKRAGLDEDLDKKLSVVDPADVSAKGKVFDEYYKYVDITQADYEKQARELFAKLSRVVIMEG